MSKYAKLIPNGQLRVVLTSDKDATTRKTNPSQPQDVKLVSQHSVYHKNLQREHFFPPADNMFGKCPQSCHVYIR